MSKASSAREPKARNTKLIMNLIAVPLAGNRSSEKSITTVGKRPTDGIGNHDFHIRIPLKPAKIERLL